ncbi:MAG: site-specific DNA-methyltransferase [Minisyncoccia bacterium]
MEKQITVLAAVDFDSLETKVLQHSAKYKGENTMGASRLFVGDNVEVMRREVPDNSVQLTVTSPPYDNLRKYNGFTWDFEAVARELFRVTKPGGVVVWVVADATVNGSETGTSFRQALYFIECGFNLHDTMIYEKVNYVPLTHNRYEQCWEYMFVFSKGKPSTFTPLRVPKRTDSKPGRFHQKPGDGVFTAAHSAASATTDKIAPNIFGYTVGSDKSGHPAAYPEKLVSDHVLTWSSPGDTVLDPFLGSGTTGKMATQLCRFFIGVDISQEYVELARARIGGMI